MSIGATAINTVILMGRLTADPELRQTAGGISSCSGVRVYSIVVSTLLACSEN